jgi:hypothetical protein
LGTGFVRIDDDVFRQSLKVVPSDNASNGADTVRDVRWANARIEGFKRMHHRMRADRKRRPAEWRNLRRRLRSGNLGADKTKRV